MLDYDVIVCGGGPSGVVAALASARNGAHTLLIEKYGFVGGSSTAAMVYPWMSFHTSCGEQVIGGIAQEIVSHLQEWGASPGHLRDTIGFVHTLTPFDMEIYKVLADQLLIEAGVEVVYHTQFVGVDMTGNHIEDIRIRDREGEHTLTARIYIDSTGDGDLAVASGASFIIGTKKDHRTQPMTMNFVMGGVDLDEIKAYMCENPGEFHSDSLIDELDHLPLTGVSGFFSIWKKYSPPEIPRDRLLFFAGMQPGEVNVNTTRIVNRNGTKPKDLSKAEQEGRTQVKLLIEFCRKYVPGFQNGYLSRLPTQIGVRETRHIMGQYVLTAEDVISAERFEDVIARSGYPLDIHDPTGSALESEKIPDGKAYDIPYRSLIPQKIDNLLLNGRCISVTHTAFSSTRLTPSCMAIGQAAGTAAALCKTLACMPEGIDVSVLQQRLREQGAILD
jgi:hypothetical protein